MANLYCGMAWKTSDVEECGELWRKSLCLCPCGAHSCARNKPAVTTAADGKSGSSFTTLPCFAGARAKNKEGCSGTESCARIPYGPCLHTIHPCNRLLFLPSSVLVIPRLLRGVCAPHGTWFCYRLSHETDLVGDCESPVRDGSQPGRPGSGTDPYPPVDPWRRRTPHQRAPGQRRIPASPLADVDRRVAGLGMGCRSDVTYP